VRKGIAIILAHILLILLAVTLFLPAYNFSFSSDNFNVNATLIPQINDRKTEEYAWYQSGSSTYIEDFEDSSHGFTESVPTQPSTVLHATDIYSYEGSLSGTVEDTYSYDGETLSAYDEGTTATASITLRIDVSSIVTGKSYEINWYTSAFSRNLHEKTIRIDLLDSAGSVITTLALNSYSGSLTQTKGSEYYVQLYIYAYDEVSTTTIGSAGVSVDWFEIDVPSYAVGEIRHDSSYPYVVYVASKAGTTSENAGFSPLFDLGYQLYGYQAADIINTTVTGTYTFVHEWDFADIEAGTAVIDFCIFVNYVTINSTLANYIKLGVEYIYTSGTVQYVVYFAPGETGTLEQGSNYIMYRTSVKTLWIGLKTFNNKQPSEIITVSGSLQKLRVKVEFSTTGTLGTDEPRCDFIVDWIGAWTPQEDQINSIKYSLFYEISHKGFENITIATVPTLDYDETAYKHVLLFYDTRYYCYSWTEVDELYTYFEKALPQLGYSVERVDADELRNYMESGAKVIVIIATKVPDTVFDATDNTLIKNWLRNSGGVLVYIESWIGYKYGLPDGTLAYDYRDGDDHAVGVDINNWRYGMNGDGSYSVRFNVTPLARSLGINVIAFNSTRCRPVIIDNYESQEPEQRYLLFAWDRRVCPDSEGKTLRVTTVALGWFKFGNGWGLILPDRYDELRKIGIDADDIVKMIAVAPFRQKKDVTNIQVWNDGYITTDVFHDDSFTECNSPDQEDPTYGAGEDFSDVSDWSCTSGSTLSTDGDIGKWTIPTTSASGNWYLWWNMDWINVYNYPFIEIRCKSTGTAAAGVILRVPVDTDGDGVQDTTVDDNLRIFAEHNTWYIVHINLYGYLLSNGITPSSSTQVKIQFRKWLGTGVDFTLYLDWVRVYGYNGYTLYRPNGADRYDTIYSDGDTITLQITTEADGAWDIAGLYSSSITVSAGDWCEARVKYEGNNPAKFFIRYWNKTAGTNIIIIDWEPSSSTDWVILRGQFPYSGTVTLEILNHEYSVSPSWTETQKFIIDYIKIGSKGDWRPIYEFSASKFYDNPYWHFYDSLISPKWNLPENVPVGVYQYQIGVLILIWGYNYVDSDYMYKVQQVDVATIRAIHTYSWDIFSSKPYVKLSYGFTWPPNLALIPLSSWLLWIYAICLDFFVIFVKKRQLHVIATLLILAGIYLIL